MDQNWCKPRKIIHLDQIQPIEEQTHKEVMQEKWKIIEETVTAYLVQDTKPPSIVHLIRALQTFLVRNMYEELHQNLIKTFYHIYKMIVNQNFLKNCSLTSLLAYYIHKKHHYRIIFDLLNSFLNGYSTNADKLTIEQKAYRILSKEVLNSQFFDNFNNQFQEIVHQFRITKNQSEMLAIEYQLKIIEFLGIYEYFDLQFIDKSKHYYVNLAQSMVKNEDIFIMIDDVMKREILLNKLLKPSQNTVSYLQKELIEEYYPFMIQYMEYLIQESKYDKLKLLWNYTMKLNDQQKQLLYLRFKQIVNDVGKYVKQGQNITKMLLFIDNIHQIIRNCFESNKIIFNTLYNTIQQILVLKQQQYNESLANKILNSQQKQSYDIIQQLFKYIPNKQKFIKQLQVYFFKWIINSNVQDAKYQQGIVQILKKECGNTLCKKIERMLTDVWRDGEMIYYQYKPANFRCRLFSLNDWPKFKFKNIVIPDSMSAIIVHFESQFKKSPQNACKELIWVNELGKVKLAINGVQSVFSQIQAALIFIINRSFRPMKQQQLVQITQGDNEEISKLLDQLRQGNIIQYNEMNQTYDINDSNTKSYFYVGTKQSKLEEESTTEKRDNSIIIDAAVVRTIKKKKLLLKTQLTNIIFQLLRNIKPTLQEANSSIQRLANRDFIQIDKMKGIIRYKE